MAIQEMQSPVIVVGMARSGTTLISEMLHLAGTSMFAEGMDPRYDGGNKYERVSCQDINLEILGVESIPAISTIWKRPLNDISEASLNALRKEVGTAPWGFKDPRTTITYPIWRKYFPEGSTIYTYRHHSEVMRHYFQAAKNANSALRRTRRAVRAWIFYNEQLLKNLESDKQADRRSALVQYEELMQSKELITRLQDAIGVALHDARNMSLRRNNKDMKAGAWEGCVYRFATLGYEKRLFTLYQELKRQRIGA